MKLAPYKLNTGQIPIFTERLSSIQEGLRTLSTQHSKMKSLRGCRSQDKNLSPQGTQRKTLEKVQCRWCKRGVSECYCSGGWGRTIACFRLSLITQNSISKNRNKTIKKVSHASTILAEVFCYLLCWQESLVIFLNHRLILNIQVKKNSWAAGERFIPIFFLIFIVWYIFLHSSPFLSSPSPLSRNSHTPNFLRSWLFRLPI